MNDQELIPEQQLTNLLELEAEKVDANLDLWKLIEKQVTASRNANLPAPDDFQSIDTVPDSLETSPKILTFPRMLKYALGVAAVLAIAFIIGTAIQPGKTGDKSDPNADIAPSKPPATIPGTIAIVPAATPSVRMLSASLKATLNGASAELRAVSWKQDGTQVAAGSDDGVINTWDTNGKFLSRVAPLTAAAKPGFPFSITWPESGDTPLIAAATNDYPGPNGYNTAKKVGDKELQITNSDGSLFTNITIPSGAIYQVAWSPDGKYIAAGGQIALPGSFDDIRVWIWKVDGTLTATIVNYDYPINSLAWSPDGKVLAIAGKGYNQAGVWAPDGTQIADLKGDFVIWDLAWSPDGQNLATASSDKLVRIYWNIGWGGDEYKLSLTGHQDEVWAVAWSPDGRTLASASSDKTVRLWTVK